MTMIVDDVKSMNNEVSRRLLKLSTNPTVAYPFVSSSYSNNTARISEQEARFCYIQLLNDIFNGVYQVNNRYLYSVETPTFHKYCFTGQEGNDRSAQTDLSLYPIGSQRIECNTEFKYGVPNYEKVYKDIFKLIRESYEHPPFEKGMYYHLLGNYYHLINNADSDTLRKLYKTMTSAMTAVNQYVKQHYPQFAGNDNVFLFTFCVLNYRKGKTNQQWSCTYIYDFAKDDPTACFDWMTALDPPREAKAIGWDVI